jgi:hypothetical protein
VVHIPEIPALTGRVIFQYLYDVGGDVNLERIPRENFSLIERPRKRGERILAPKYEEVGLAPLEIDLGSKRIDRYRATIEGRIFPVGVIGIYISIEFRKLSFDGLTKLVGLNERKVKTEGRELEFDDIPMELFKEVKKAISPAITYPYPTFEYPQIYTLVLIADSDPKLGSHDFLKKYRKQTVGVLRCEREWRSLSEKEVEDALKPYLSYSDEDVVIIDWYSALVSGAVEYVDDIVRMIEFAQIQLLELKTYDRLLDQSVERMYGSLRATYTTPWFGIAWMSRQYRELTRTTRELTELRIEVTDLVADLRNILKFTGEWYLGKVYRVASERFRIGDWLGLVDKKLSQLQEFYTMAMDRVNTHRMHTLEFLIVLILVVWITMDVLGILGVL